MLLFAAISDFSKLKFKMDMEDSLSFLLSSESPEKMARFLASGSGRYATRENKEDRLFKIGTATLEEQMFEDTMKSEDGDSMVGLTTATISTGYLSSAPVTASATPDE